MKTICKFNFNATKLVSWKFVWAASENGTKQRIDLFRNNFILFNEIHCLLINCLLLLLLLLSSTYWSVIQAINIQQCGTTGNDFLSAKNISDLSLQLNDTVQNGDIGLVHAKNPLNSSNNGEKRPIIIGYLTNLYGRHIPDRQGLSISGAILYAVNYINNERPELLNGRQLKLIYNDTAGIAINATAAVIWQWRYGAVAFIGPEDTCEVEATIASALNLPMISYKCANSAVSNKAYFPTFARTHPPDVIVVRSILAFLQYYQWQKFGIIWYKQSQKFAPVVSTLRLMANENEFEITVDYPFDSEVDCCIYQRDCCGKIWHRIVEQTYKRARIFVLFAEVTMLPHFLLAMKSKGLLDTGEMVVILVDLNEDYFDNQFDGFMMSQQFGLPEYQINAMYQAINSRSLFVITRNLQESPNYSFFKDKVREYNKLPPFCLDDPAFPMTLKRHISSYASYLYDAVILYAEALSEVLKEGLTEYDGKDIIQKIIQRRRYQSITGSWMHIDQNGDVQGNYTVFQLVLAAHSDQTKRSLFNNNLNGQNNRKQSRIQMNPVGLFEYDTDSSETITFVQTNSINWVKPGHVPLDEPPCGFDNKGCDNNSKDAKIREIITVILLAILIATIIILIITYRGWKNEQEIDGLLWKISRDDVCIKHKNKMLSNSRDSLTSFSYDYSINQLQKDDNNTNSNGSSGGCSGRGEALTPNGDDEFEITYKGVIVSFKVLKFNKKNCTNPFDCLTRDNKMEMKWLKEMHHQNINVFIGATVHELYPCSVLLLSEYCAKGSLRDVLENEDIRLDEEFLSSLIHDIMLGLSYLHKSDLRCHGNLKSTNCVVTSRFVVKLNDFGLFSFRKDDPDPQISLYNKLWKAPESLRNPNIFSPESDIYSFGIILHEIAVRKGPFAIKLIDDKILFDELQKIIDQVIAGPNIDNQYRRPDTNVTELNDDIIDMMTMCWHEDPLQRPTIDSFRVKLKNCRKFRPPPEKLMENMVKMMEVYQDQLEDLVDKRTQQLDEEKKKTETLLYQMLPESVARQLICGQTVIPETFENVTIFFSDIVGFTKLSKSSTPMEIVTFLNDLYCLFDSIVSQYKVYKVETIGDAYMVVSGLPLPYDQHCSEIASMALEMLEAIKTFQIRHRQDEHLKLRIGLHTGPVVAGVVGTKMPRYCLFGDTVNTASRMESNGEALKIHISPECRERLAITKEYIIKERGFVFLKGIGDIKTYWLMGHVGPAKFRFDSSKFTYVDSPWIQQDKVPLDIFNDISNRKGSLIGIEKNEKNLAKFYKNALAMGGMNTSYSLLNTTHSNSCQFHGKAENHLSPKSLKKNWPLKKIFNAKIRFNSINSPESDSNNIALKENKNSNNNTKAIIKSTSYNMIESLNMQHHLAERMLPTMVNQKLQTPPNSPTSAPNVTNLINIETNENVKSNENEPLLVKKCRRIPNKNRKSSLQEVDEDVDKNEDVSVIKCEPLIECVESPEKPNGIIISIDNDEDEDEVVDEESDDDDNNDNDTNDQQKALLFNNNEHTKDCLEVNMTSDTLYSEDSRINNELKHYYRC